MYTITAIFPNGSTKDVGITPNYSEVRTFLNERYLHDSPCIFVIEHI